MPEPTPAPEDPQTLIDSIDALTGRIDSVLTETKELHDYGRKNRQLIRRQWKIIVGLCVLGLIAIGLGIGLIVTVNHDHHTAEVAKAAAEQAQRNAVNAEQVCQQGNIARAATRSLWERIFTLPPIQALSPAEQAARDTQTAIVRTQINTSYADQDCKKLGPHGP
jgi:hypothetical protein